MTVTFDDNSPNQTFTVQDGRGIESISKSGDTVTINYTDNTTDTFEVSGWNARNARDGRFRKYPVERKYPGQLFRWNHSNDSVCGGRPWHRDDQQVRGNRDCHL